MELSGKTKHDRTVAVSVAIIIIVVTISINCLEQLQANQLTNSYSNLIILLIAG